jgi:hypothetical protein
MPRTLRIPTLRIVDLIATRVQSVKIELIGQDSRILDRLGAFIVFIPMVIVGYAFVLVSLMMQLGSAIGWGWSLFLFGVAHLAFGVWGIVRGRPVGVFQHQEVLEPQFAPVVAEDAAGATARDAIPGSFTAPGLDGRRAPAAAPAAYPFAAWQHRR